MSDYTVEDIINAPRQSLRERAKAAGEEARAVAKEAFDAQADETLHEAYCFCERELGVSPEALDAADWTTRPHHPTVPSVEAEIEGVLLRFRFVETKIAEIDKSGTKEPIYDSVFWAEVKHNSTWRRIKSLADLGKEIS